MFHRLENEDIIAEDTANVARTIRFVLTQPADTIIPEGHGAFTGGAAATRRAACESQPSQARRNTAAKVTIVMIRQGGPPPLVTGGSALASTRFLHAVRPQTVWTPGAREKLKQPSQNDAKGWGSVPRRASTGKRWVRGVKTVSTAPPPRTFTGSAESIARTMARKEVSPKGIGSGIRMIQFYINRAGKNLSASRRRELERAKRILQQRRARRTAWPRRRNRAS
jgi:uncharacterized protein DUF3175